MTPDPFALLGLAPRFDLSPQEVERAWLARSVRAHPDRAGDAVRAAEAVREAALLNDARMILRDPFRRAEALLDLRGAVARRELPLPPEFLVEMLERRERLEDASSAGDHRALSTERADLEGSRSSLLAEVADEFAHGGTIDGAVAERIRRRLHMIRTIDRLREEWADRRSGGE